MWFINYDDYTNMSQFYLDKIEALCEQNIPIGTVFDIILKNPYKYCKEEFAEAITDNYEDYKLMFDNLGLKEGYSRHLGGTYILNKLFDLGFPETFIIKYVL